MVPSTDALVESLLPPPGASFTRSDSIASSTGSVSGLKRRSRTKTRSVALAKRGRSLGPQAGSSGRYESDAGESFLDFDDAPPIPTLLTAEPEEMTSQERRAVKQARRRSRTVGAEARPTFDGLHPGMPHISRARSAVDVREPLPEQSRGRQAKSDNGSVKGVKSRLRALSLSRQALRQNSQSDCSSQASPQTPSGFSDGSAVRIAVARSSNPRDSILTQGSSTSSSLYPASTSVGTRTESSMPYTDDQDEGEMSYPDIVTPEHPDFDPDDVSNRLRLLLNNSYFLPPAHTKPSPLSFSPNPAEPAKKSKPTNSGFLDFFRIGKSKSKPTTPVPGSPPAVDSSGPILRTTCDTPTASGLLRPQPQLVAVPPATQQQLPPASRVVVLRERMDDLATAAKEAEKELRSKDPRKAKSQTTPRDRIADDVIDPTDAVDLPPQIADAMFAFQASAAYGLGPQASLNAAVLADRLVPNSPGIWSISSEEDAWRKDLLREAVSHSLNNTPEHSFSSTSSGAAHPPASPPPQSEASFPTPAMLGAQKSKIGQRILEDLSIHTSSSDQSPPVSPLEPQYLSVKNGPPSSGEKSPKTTEHPMLSAIGPPARAETPAYMPLPLAPPPRKQLVNPLYSLSQPDLPEAVSKSEGPSAGSSSASYHTVRKASSTPGLSGTEEVAVERGMLSLSPPPLPDYQGSKRGISPDSRNLEGMPSFTTSRSRTENESRYSSDSISFRTPLDTDVEMAAARPSMSLSLPSGRPSMSVSVSEYSMPSPTASAFGDAVFGSCRPPSVLSRRSVSSQPVPPVPELPPLPPQPPVTPRSAAISPPPRLSSSVSPTQLPIPPRPRAARPTFRPSTSTRDSRSSGSRSRPSQDSPAASEQDPAAQDASVNNSFSSPSSSPMAPLAARRGLGSPLSLTIPGRVQPPVIHSAPAPASPTDFFDRIQTTIHNAMDDLETSDSESESDDDSSIDGAENARSQFNHAPPGQSPSTLRTEPRPPPAEAVETAQVFVEPRTLAISNRASSSSARPSIMRLGNHSTPQLSPMSSFSTREPVPQFSYDRKKPIGNIADLGRRSFSSSRSPFNKKGKNIAHMPNSPLLPIGAMPSSPIAPGTSFTRASSSAVASSTGVQKSKEKGGKRRPATAPEKEKGKEGKKIQRESIQRFDGMLMQHLVAERDRMKRITHDYLSTSTTSSPVQTRPSMQLPFGKV